MQQLAQESRDTSDPQHLQAIFHKSNKFAKYEGDSAFQETISTIEDRLRQKQLAETVAEPPMAPAYAVQTDPPPAVYAPAPGVQPIQTPPPPKAPATGVSAKSMAMNPKILGGVAAFAVIVLLILGVRSYSNARSKTVAAKLEGRPVPVHVNLESPDSLKVVDANGTDVTENLDFGLGTGEYRLTASRAGFAPVLAPFIIDPANETERTLDLHWLALPTQVQVILEGSGGTLKLDNQPADGSGIKTDLMDGPHTIQWGISDKDYVDIQFEIKQASVTMTKPNLHGNPGVSGMAAALSQKSVSAFAINLNGGITESIAGQAQALGSEGSFDVPRGQKISFSATRFNGHPFGDLYADPGGQPAVYVYLVPPPGGRPGGGKRNQVSEPVPGKAPDTSAVPAESPRPPAPPKLSESELKEKQEQLRREELRKKLGIK